MLIDFVKLCESILNHVEVLEESKRVELDPISRKALTTWKRKQAARTQEEQIQWIKTLFDIRKEFIEIAKKPDLYSKGKTPEEIEKLMVTMAENEAGEHPRVHGTHFITWGYLKQFDGLFEK